MQENTERRGKFWVRLFLFVIWHFLNRHLIHLISQPCTEDVLLLHMAADTFRKGSSYAHSNHPIFGKSTMASPVLNQIFSK